jgi:uncharacterized YccA/Bax inhibitor family protein
MNSKNPLLKDSAMNKAVNKTADTQDFREVINKGEVMTVDGAVNKTLILFSLMMITTFVSYMMPSQMFMYIGIFGGLAAVMFASFKPHLSGTVAPIYALLEGLFVGTVSAIYAAQFDGIIFQAVSLTFGTLLMMLAIYKSGLIKVTAKFKMGIAMATGAIFIVYLVSFIGSFIGFNVPYLHEGGPIGIGVSIVIIAVASLNLLVDFDSFEKGAEHGAPKYMEWFCGMGLLVTLVWLYWEFLRLLSKLQRD